MNNEDPNRPALPTDANHKTVMGGVSSSDGTTPLPAEIDPVTGALLVKEVNPSSGGAGGRYADYSLARQDLDGDPIYIGYEDIDGNFVIIETDFTNQTTLYYEGTGGIATGSNWSGRAGHAYVEFNALA